MTASTWNAFFLMLMATYLVFPAFAGFLTKRLPSTRECATIVFIAVIAAAASPYICGGITHDEGLFKRVFLVGIFLVPIIFSMGFMTAKRSPALPTGP